MGEVTVGDDHLDFGSGSDDLNLTSPVPSALLVKRTCYIYQKFEDSSNEVKRDMVGGGETHTTTYSVREDWTADGPGPGQLEHLADETNQRGAWDDLVSAAGAPESAAPPPEPSDQQKQLQQMMGVIDQERPPHGVAVSSSAHVGGFGLSRSILMGEPAAFATQWDPVPPEFLPETVAGCDILIRGTDNVLRTFDEGVQPQNGDCKVVFEYVRDGFDCSFVVEQILAKSDPELGGAVAALYGVDRCDVPGRCGDDLGDIWMVRRGRHDLKEMVNMAKEDEKRLLYIFRVVGWVLLCGGWIMLFSPFTTVLQVLPILSTLGYFAVVLTALIVSCLCCFTVTTLAYLRYRPLIGIGLLSIALGIWGIVAWRLNIAAESGGEPEETRLL